MSINCSIITIGDEILIGQVLDTNSSAISRLLGEAGIHVPKMISVGDSRDDIMNTLRKELSVNPIVITTGGLGPTKDDITKAVLAELSGSRFYVENKVQTQINREILHARGLDSLDINKAQSMVPDRCEVIPNRRGTAPIMVFRFNDGEFPHPATLYAMPGVPHETLSAMPEVINDIQAHYQTTPILHRNLMVYGIAESALSKKIETWESALPDNLHLAYLPNMLTGIRLRLDLSDSSKPGGKELLDSKAEELKSLLGNLVYSDHDDTLAHAVGELLRKKNLTLSCAESCTGGNIAHLITTVPGSSSYFLGSVTSYAISVKEQVLGVPAEIIEKEGVVSSAVAAAMAEGVRRLTGSDYAVATTGLAGPGDDGINPVGTVWIAVSGPRRTVTESKIYHNDRIRNIDRFTASALDLLRRVIESD